MMAEEEEKKKLEVPLEGVIVESVGAESSSFTVAVPEEPPPPINPDDAVKAACESAAGIGSGREGAGGANETRFTSNSNGESEENWLAKLSKADARLSAAAAASDAAVKQRIDNSGSFPPK